MAKDWDFSGLDAWMSDVADTRPKDEIRDEYDVEKRYPYRNDTVPRVSYVELAWLGYYVVTPVKKAWDVTTCDGMVFHNNDRRTAVREAQAYCTAYARGKNLSKHLPKPLRPVNPKIPDGTEPPF